jgi:diacylglycerol kinase family enzyme
MSTSLTERPGRPAILDAGLSSEKPPVKRRMLLIVNPYASTVSERLSQLVIRALESRFEVEPVRTEARGHATVLSHKAARDGYDLVVAFGGDGTVNEAANGLLGTRTPLCCLPGGSANVFGKMLGVPGDLVDATEHLLALGDGGWHPRRVSLGVVNGRCFTFSSGVGLDASVVERVDANPRRKARWGPYYYTWIALTTFLRRYVAKPPRMEVDDGARTIAGVTTILQNGSPFTYFKDREIEIAEGATLESDALAGAVLHRATPVGMSFVGLRAFSRRARVVRHRQVTGLSSVRELRVRTADGRPLPLEVDGDYLGEVPEARYSVLPDALNVVA